MIIANPIYDVTFKRLLENDRAAKFLIGTILDCNVASLAPAVSERTKYDRNTGELTLFRKIKKDGTPVPEISEFTGLDAMEIEEM
ncbi:MAG: hypothetical protein LBB74_02760 [Chitinispirillales bacterium]|jgi:hypothetical protein|nr:hypothetical protein [Chitinispirillales bacterium]